jgi:hypothetical protein
MHKAIFISEGEMLNCSLLSNQTKFRKMGIYSSKYNTNVFIKLRRLIQAEHVEHTEEIRNPCKILVTSNKENGT